MHTMNLHKSNHEPNAVDITEMLRYWLILAPDIINLKFDMTTFTQSTIFPMPPPLVVLSSYDNHSLQSSD